MTKILFYTSIPRSFRTTLIGHLYEICQKYPVVLLSEELPPEVNKMLKDKSLFPNLLSILPVNQFTGQEESSLKKYRRLHSLAKEVVGKHRPSIVITANDLYPFEMYLLRHARRNGAVTICIQPGAMIESTVGKKWIDLTHAYTKLPSFIPISFRLFLMQLRKYSRYFIYHWLAPLLVGEFPFPSMASLPLGTTAVGTRTDYKVVLSKQDYNLLLKEGIPERKLMIMAHPLTRGTKKIFSSLLHHEPDQRDKSKSKIACLMLPSEVRLGFRRKNLSLITEEQYEKGWLGLIELIHKTLPHWDIYIKPHPSGRPLAIFQEKLKKISGRINLVSRGEPAEKYIRLASIIIGLPPSASTTLFIASLLRPELPIISVDTEKELLGDYYKSFPGIEYVVSKIELEKVLKLIQSGKYKKQSSRLTHEGFKNTIELIQYVLNQNPGHPRPRLT